MGDGGVLERGVSHPLCQFCQVIITEIIDEILLVARVCDSYYTHSTNGPLLHQHQQAMAGEKRMDTLTHSCPQHPKNTLFVWMISF